MSLPELGYSSTTVYLLDRQTQTVEPMMMYPSTRVVLNEIRGESVVAVRIFVANDNGQWVEEQ